MDALDSLYTDHVAGLERAYAKVLAEERLDAIAIHSGVLTLRSTFDDQHWPLRPVPHWQHWIPLTEPECVLVFRPERPPVLLRLRVSNFWEKPLAPETDAFAELFETVWVHGPEDRDAYVGGGHVAWVGEPRALASCPNASNVNPSGLIRALDALRVHKSPYEVACIASANRRAAEGHNRLRNVFAQQDASELDLHLEYLRATAQDDSETPYKNIVALGPNAATLHHIAYGRRGAPREAECLLVDAGATCRGYCADITRTWVKGRGAAADAHAALITGVDALQRRLCEAVRVGQPFEDLHDLSHREVAGVLREVGLARGSVDELVSAGITRAFYPHGLGHSLGLQTHDVGCALRKPRGDNPFLRNTSRITEGQIFTIEPGVYFIETLLDALRARPEASLVDWKQVAVLAPLGGVRVEDDLAIGTDGGVRNMTREVLEVGAGRA